MTITRQELFDRTLAHLRAQGRPSVAEDAAKYPGPRCRYRHVAEDGVVLRCAAGYWIPDDRYRADLEGPLDGEILRLMPRGIDVVLLQRLQNIHDWASTKKYIDFGLANDAIVHAMNSAPLEFMPRVEAGFQALAAGERLEYTPPSAVEKPFDPLNDCPAGGDCCPDCGGGCCCEGPCNSCPHGEG